jgi:hypothetical protein
MLTAILHPPIHKQGVRYTGRYSVEFDGEMIVVNSFDPECDAADFQEGRSNAWLSDDYRTSHSMPGSCRTGHIVSTVNDIGLG